jgi:hypothetical protein
VNDSVDPFGTSGPDPFATRVPNAGLTESSTGDGNFSPATDTQLEGDLTGSVAAPVTVAP